MKFTDFIFEMAYNQNRAIEKIEDLLPELSKHILKVWLIPESENYKHWISEIKNWVDKISDYSRVKTPFGVIKYSKFKKEFGGYFDTKYVSNKLEVLKSNYNLGIVDVKKLSKNMDAIYDYLWEAISSKTFNITEFIKTIQGYGEKCN